LRRLGGRAKEGPVVADRYKVVPAAMPDIRQRVVLCEERNRGTALRSDSCTERRLELADPAFDRVAVPFEQCGDRLCGVALLICELGMSVDVTRERHKRQGLRTGERAHRAVHCPSDNFPILTTRVF